MRYTLNSIKTWSFWRYALVSNAAIAKIFATLGVLYLFLEIIDFFGIYTKDQFSKFSIIPMFVLAIFYVVLTRRPITKISYKLPSKDYLIEVQIGDIFEGSNDVVISTATTFDTEMANGLIATDSLQGQVATKFFNSNTVEIDKQLEETLKNLDSKTRSDAPGKKKEFPIGTVAPIRSHGRTFYFVAMSRLSKNGTAGTSLREVEDALESLWKYILENGELKDLSIPLMGTGRGRTGFPRKKMAERIAQSFADGSKTKIFCNRIRIVIRPEDAEKFEVNLYEIRDYLMQSLHP